MRATELVLMSLVFASVLLLSMGTTPASAQTQGVLTLPDPEVALAGYNGAAFDAAYIRYLYQLNMDIATVADMGSKRAQDRKLREFAAKIRGERIDINQSLGQWYPRVSDGQAFTADPRNAQDLISELNNLRGLAFDANFASMMIPLMQQSMDAANVAKERAVTPEVRDQVRLVWKTNSNEKEAFERWLDTGFLTFFEHQWYCENQYQYGYGYDPRCFGMVIPRGPLSRRGGLWLHFGGY